MNRRTSSLEPYSRMVASLSSSLPFLLYSKWRLLDFLFTWPIYPLFFDGYSGYVRWSLHWRRCRWMRSIQALWLRTRYKVYLSISRRAWLWIWCVFSSVWFFVEVIHRFLMVVVQLFGFGSNNYYRDVLILVGFILGFGVSVIGFVWFAVRERR